MPRLRPFFAVLPLVLAGGLLADGVSADVVLLKSGAVLAGEVVETDAAVVVRVAAGSELRLRPGDVATVQPSLAAAHEWLRAGGSGTADDHLGLAEWCIRQQLWPQAARELLDARAIDPGSRRAELLERRLTLLSRPQPVDGRSDARPVRQAAAETPRDGAPAAEFELPADGLQGFTRRIQPLVVNNCTNGGCHAAGSDSSFRLDRRLLHGYADARSTGANLRAVLAAIDPANPADSPLLAAARGPHAGVAPFSGPRREEWLERLSDWVDEVARAHPRAAQPTPPEPTGVVVAAYEAPVEEAGGVAQASWTDEPARVVRGAALRPVEPRDEFDAATFNRRHRTPEDDLPLGAGGR